MTGKLQIARLQCFMNDELEKFYHLMNDDWESAYCKAAMFYEWWVGNVYYFMNDLETAYCNAAMLYEWWVGKFYFLKNDDWETAYCKAAML